MSKFLRHSFYSLSRYSDKQEEIDIPSLRVEDTEHNEPSKRRSSKPDAIEEISEDKSNVGSKMSEISGVRKLKHHEHTSRFSGVVPKYGVETVHEEELGKVNGTLD